MNERIEYEDEVVTEEVYKGTLILDGHLSEKQQKNQIFEMMRNAGIEVENEDEYSIGYVGADDNDGISETQTSVFVVTRTYKKKVPYRVTTEDIYTGEYILDGLRKTEEEQRHEIFEMMKKDGIEIEDSDDIVIGYTGADDNDGISETQTTQFVVQRVKKEKIEQDLGNLKTDTEVTEEEKIRKLYDELVTLREQVKNTTSAEMIAKLYDRITEVTSLLDELIDNSTKNYGAFEEALSSIDKEIFAIEEMCDENRKEYERLFEEMKEFMGEHRDLINNSTASQEEFDKLNNALIDKMNACNNQSLRVKKKLDSLLQDLSGLYAKKEKINNDFAIARSLGIPATDFIEITEKLNRRDIIDNAIESYDLKDIIATNYKERKPEDKQKLKDAKAEIYAEVERIKKIDEVDSILNKIDALYSIDRVIDDNSKRRVLIVKPNSLSVINDKVNNLPEKVVKSDDVSPNYVPSEAPKDMEEVLNRVKEDSINSESVEAETVNTSSEVVDEVDPSLEFIPGTNIKKPRGREAYETDEEYVAYLEEYYNNAFPPKQDTNDDLLKDRIVLYKDKTNPNKYYAKGPACDRFNATRLSDMVRIDGVACYEISEENAQYIIGNANNSYSPYIVDILEKEDILDTINGVNVEEEHEIPNDNLLTDRFVIYRDGDKYYAKKPVFDRFNRNALGEMVRINGFACYEIGKDSVDYIFGNANNSYSPYVVSFEDVNNINNVQTNVDSPDEKSDDANLNNETNPELPGVNTIINDLNDTSGEDSTKEESSDIDYDDEKNDPLNKQNGAAAPVPPAPPSPPTSPVPPVPPIPSVEDPTMNNNSSNPKPVNTENGITENQQSSGPKEEIITLYRDITNNNQVYASDDVVRRFGIPVSTSPVKIDGHDCYKISKDTDQIINSIAKMSRDPKFTVVYKNVSLEKDVVEARPHVEEIIDKLTDNLDIRARDCKRFTASNLRIANSFRNELSSGNVAYNIVHVVPAIVRAGTNFIRKICGRLLSSRRGREAMTTIQDRLDNLSEVELEVLFDEYKGSQLKTDMNNQINPLILDRIREYGLSKVERLNDEIRTNYTVLFTILGQVRVLEEQLNSDSLSPAEATVLEDQRRQLIEAASQNIRSILDSRNKANNLLSSGVHGIEEDFKAVATKLNYVGLRFSRTNDFDNELQHRLGNFGRNLNVALSADNAEAIVQNFMGLESCYYENTEIRGSLVGRRSVGSKYYTPIAEQFDYRDDPFMRDLLTTVAVTSATISAINAARVHQIESKQILDDQRAQADTVNMQNDSTMDYVHQTGADIAGKRDTFSEGMAAQSNQDVLTDADVIERATLDTHNWRFNDAYHAADDAGHAMYNQFYNDVSSRINDVTSQYASGAISSAEALQRMSQISSDAQATLVDTVNSSLDIIRNYASTHSQFDLKAVEESMSYITAHPGAIANMNQAMVDVTNLAEGLTSLQATHMSALTSLPSDMASTIVCAASSALLAMNVSSSMNRNYGKKNGYGNEITEMMDEYMYGADSEDEYDDEIEDSRSR